MITDNNTYTLELVMKVFTYLLCLIVSTAILSSQDFRFGLKAGINADYYDINSLNEELAKLHSDKIQGAIITPSIGLTSRFGKFGVDISYTPKQTLQNQFSNFNGDTSRIPVVAFSIARFDMQLSYAIPILNKTSMIICATGSVSNPYLLISGIYQRQNSQPYYKWNELWRDAQYDGTERITLQFANSNYTVGSYGMAIGLETECSEHLRIQGNISYYKLLGDYVMGRLSDSYEHFTPNLLRMSIQTSYYF